MNPGLWERLKVWVLGFFGCQHTKTTRPVTINKETYVACLDCGEHIPYELFANRPRGNA